MKTEKYLRMFHEYKGELLRIAGVCVVVYVVGMLGLDWLPAEKTEWDKIMHFFCGGAALWMFWYVLRQHQRAHRVHELWFVFGGLWGASGLFFLRWFLSAFGVSMKHDTFLFTALPDWDIVIWSISAHRNILFHSAIFPVLLLSVGIIKKNLRVRDFGIGLMVGVASHLLYDVIQASGNVAHLDRYLGNLWLIFNAIGGTFFAYSLIGKSAFPVELHKDNIIDSLD